MTSVDLGWGRKPIPEQLLGSRIPVEALEQAEKDADALMRLFLRGLITDSMKPIIAKKILKRMEEAIPEEAP